MRVPGRRHGGGGTPPPFASGLPGDAPLSTLTAAQWQTICDRGFAYYDANHIAENLCRAQAPFTAELTHPATDAELRAACQTCLDACIASMDIPALRLCPHLSATSSCTATVAEYEGCLGGLVASYAAAGRSAPACDRLTLEAASTAAATGDPCLPLTQKCPGVSFPSRGETGGCLTK